MSALPVLHSVSVVIPAYNYAHFLGAAIASVLRQDHAEFEVLIVDDGSTDNTSTLVASFTDPRIRYIHQDNAGLSAARNTGIRNSRHPLIGFLDADDEWLPEHLSSAVKAFQHLNPSFAVVATGSVRIDSDGKLLPAHRPGFPTDREVRASEIIVKTRFMPSTAVVRREAFEDCGFFDTTLRSSEDRDMWIRIAKRRRIFLLSTATVHIRKHGANMSKQADRMRLSMSTVIRRAYQNRVVPQWRFPVWLEAWSLYFAQSSWMLHDSGRLGEAVRDACLAIGVCPWPLRAASLNERPFFRLRAFLRFVAKLLSSR